MGRFEGRVVVVTGAGGNVARGILALFASEGAHLALIDRSEISPERLRDVLGDARYITLTADLSRVDDVEDVANRIIGELGGLDVLIHTAGGFGMGDPVHALNLDVFHQMMTINALVTYVTCGVFARHMVDRGQGGSIVTILAKAGLSGGKNMAAYSASKAAAERIVQSMAQELREHNVRINGIMPSIVDTPANRKDMPNADFSKWVTSEQIADVCAFLASPAAEAISGASLPVYNRV